MTTTSIRATSRRAFEGGGRWGRPSAMAAAAARTRRGGARPVLGRLDALRGSPRSRGRRSGSKSKAMGPPGCPNRMPPNTAAGHRKGGRGSRVARSPPRSILRSRTHRSSRAGSPSGSQHGRDNRPWQRSARGHRGRRWQESPPSRDMPIAFASPLDSSSDVRRPVSLCGVDRDWAVWEGTTQSGLFQGLSSQIRPALPYRARVDHAHAPKEARPIVRTARGSAWRPRPSPPQGPGPIRASPATRTS